MLVKKKHWYLRRFCSVKDENRPKTSQFTLFFSERVENTVFLRCFFQQGALNVPHIPRFFSSCFHFQFSKQTNQKQWYLQSFDKTTCKKKPMFWNNFSHFFSSCSSSKKSITFCCVFATPQSGLKKALSCQKKLN